MRRHGDVLPDGDGALVLAAGRRHGQRGAGPEGVGPHLPAAAPIPGGGDRAGGSSQDAERRHGAAGSGDGELHHHRPLHLQARQRRDGLLQVRGCAQLPEKGRRGTPYHQRQPSGGTAGQPCKSRCHPRDTGAGGLCGDDLRRGGDPGRDEWLQDLLAGWQGEDPQALAGEVLAESVRREHLQDDCAVQVLYRPVEDGPRMV